MPTSAYWRKRFEAMEADSHKKAVRTDAQTARAFARATREIDAKIHEFYGRYADNNKIDLTEAKRQLTAKELTGFKWDVQEYIKRGQENALDQKWMRELENASIRARISRLDALRLSVKDTCQNLYAGQEERVSDLLENVYTNDFERTVFEIQRGIGTGWDVPKPDRRRVEAVLAKPWTTDGVTFSDRIWRHQSQLTKDLHTLLTQNMILGKGPDESVKTLADRMGVARRQAGRVIMTESAHFGNQAQYDAYRELGVEEYQVVGTLDSVTCAECGAMDGEHFPMSQREVGITAPVFHPNCRCVTAPWFEDNDGGERIARNADGKTYHVPKNMTFEEWKEKNKNKSTNVLTNEAAGIKLNSMEQNISIMGGAMGAMGAMGALDPDSKEADDYAKRQYAAIRTYKDDIKKIAHNTGLPEKVVADVKHHVFIANDHNLGEGKIDGFEPNPDIAWAWARLENGADIRASDIVLLKHEYRESVYMNKYGYDYPKAHIEANKFFNWVDIK